MQNIKSKLVVRSAFRAAGIGIFLISAVLNMLMLTGPVFMLQVYDRVLASNSVPTLAVLAGITLALYAMSGVLDALRSRALSRISMMVYAKLTEPVMRANAQLPLLGGAKAASMQPAADLQAIRRFLSSSGPAAFFDVPFMPGYFLILFWFHPALGTIAFGGGVLIFLLVVLSEFAMRRPSREVSKATYAKSQIIDGARRNAEAVAAMGMLGRFNGILNERLKDYYVAQEMASDRSHFFSTAIKTVRLILQSAILGYGAYLAIYQEISPGLMIAASIIMSRAISPIEQAVGNWPAFVASRQATARLDKAIELSSKGTGTEGMPLPQNDLVVEQVAVTAPGDKAVLLQAVEFKLSRGDGVGIIGPSGSGKTTLVRGLVGVWPLIKGSVRLDGSTLDQWLEGDRGSIIGYLPQDVELLDGTVADNIARFQKDAQIKDIVAAAELAGIHRLIVGLPEGYETWVGDSGIKLSAGQRQRIGLARAIFGTPFLVVLDEPNANLDTEGEVALTKVIGELRQRGSIVVVVSHRGNVLAAVNKVLFVQNGRQIAFGEKEEILSQLAMIQKPQGEPGSTAGKVLLNA